MNVLIVDDDGSTLDFLKTFVHWTDLGVTSSVYVKNTKAARTVLAEQTVDLIVCDIEMPQESGLEFLEWARLLPGIREMILITCHAEFEYAKRAIQLGTSEYILKPIQIPEFENSIRRAHANLAARRKLQSDSACWNHNKNLVEHEVIRELISSPFEQAPAILQRADEKGIPWLTKRFGAAVIAIVEKTDDKKIQEVLEGYQSTWNLLYAGMMDFILLVMVCDEEKGIEKQVEGLAGLFRNVPMEGVYAFDFPVQKLSLLASQAVKRYGSHAFEEVNGNELDMEQAQDSLAVKRQLVQEIKRYLEDHYPEELTMNDISNMFGYDKDYLTRVFKYHEKTTIMDYLTHIRLRQAKKLLQNNSLTVSEIAGMVGFNSISYFSKLFNKETGMNAKEYRNKRRAE